MAQPYVYLRYRSTPNAQMAAFKSVDRQVTQIGSDFGIDGQSLSADISQFSRIIHWENDLYALDEQRIFKFDVANSGIWGVAHTFSNPVTAVAIGATQRLGLTPCSVDGVPVLVCGYPTTGGTEEVKIVRITSSGIFEDAAVDLSAAAHSSSSATTKIFASPISHRNTIVWGTASQAIVYDLKTGSAAVTTAWPNPGNTAPSLCVFRDKVFGIKNNSATDVAVFRLDGTTWTSIASLHSTGSYNDARIRNLILPFEDKICTFSTSASPEATYSHMLEFAPGSTSSPVVTDNSVAVYAGDFGGNTDANTARVGSSLRFPQFFARVDLLTNGPSSPIYQIEWVLGGTSDPVEGSNSIELYSWAPPSGELVFVDAGLDVITYSRINNVDSTGGEFIWPGSGVLNASSPTLSVNGTNVNATYEIFGPSSTSGLINLRLLYDIEGEYVFSQGTIDTTDVGVLVVNDVTGLSPGDIVTVSWAAAVDGVKVGDNPKVASHVFT